MKDKINFKDINGCIFKGKYASVFLINILNGQATDDIEVITNNNLIKTITTSELIFVKKQKKKQIEELFRIEIKNEANQKMNVSELNNIDAFINKILGTNNEYTTRIK